MEKVNVTRPLPMAMKKSQNSAQTVLEFCKKRSRFRNHAQTLRKILKHSLRHFHSVPIFFLTKEIGHRIKTSNILQTNQNFRIIDFKH